MEQKLILRHEEQISIEGLRKLCKDLVESGLKESRGYSTAVDTVQFRAAQVIRVLAKQAFDIVF